MARYRTDFEKAILNSVEGYGIVDVNVNEEEKLITFTTSKSYDNADTYVSATVDFLENVEKGVKDKLGINIETSGEGESAENGGTFTISYETSANLGNHTNVINPDNREYADDTLWNVGIYPGAGAELKVFNVYAQNEEEALNIAVAYAEENARGILTSYDEMYELIHSSYEEEYNEFVKDNEDADEMLFATEYLNNIYVDATSEGASEIYFIDGSTLQIDQVDNSKKTEGKLTENEELDEKFYEKICRACIDTFNLEWVTTNPENNDSVVHGYFADDEEAKKWSYGNDVTPENFKEAGTEVAEGGDYYEYETWEDFYEGYCAEQIAEDLEDLGLDDFYISNEDLEKLGFDLSDYMIDECKEVKTEDVEDIRQRELDLEHNLEELLLHKRFKTLKDITDTLEKDDIKVNSLGEDGPKDDDDTTDFSVVGNVQYEEGYDIEIFYVWTRADEMLITEVDVLEQYDEINENKEINGTKQLNEKSNDGQLIGTVTSEAGSFYIGDVCYVLNDDNYHKIWGDKYGFSDGVIDFPTVNGEEGQFVVHGTAYGDGCYLGIAIDKTTGKSIKSNDLGVDAGVIGVVPLDLVAKIERAEKDGMVIEGNKATMYYDNGLFIIDIDNKKVVKVNTAGDDEYDEDNQLDENKKVKTESKSNTINELADLIKSRYGNDIEAFRDEIRIIMRNDRNISNVIHSLRTRDYAGPYQALVQCCNELNNMVNEKEGTNYSSSQVQTALRECGIDYKELLEPLTQEVKEIRKKVKTESDDKDVIKIKDMDNKVCIDCPKGKIVGDNTEPMETKKKEEYYMKPEEDKIIWDTEFDYYDDEIMQNIKEGEYQEYLDEYAPEVLIEPYEDWLYSDWIYDRLYDDFCDYGVDWYDYIKGVPEDFLEEIYNDEYIPAMKEAKPLEFEEWYKNFISDGGFEFEFEAITDDFEDNILPMIDTQLSENVLMILGDYGSNYPDFKPSEAGGIFFENGVDGLENYFAENWDRCCITDTNGELGVICVDHDGTVSGRLYTLPTGDKLKELIKAMGYEDRVKNDYDEEDLDKYNIEDLMETEFNQNLIYGGIDTSDLTPFAEYLVPVKNNL